MSTLRELLAEAAADVETPRWAPADDLRQRGRRRNNRRTLVATAFAVLLVLAATVAVWPGVARWHDALPSRPVEPTPVSHPGGLIMVSLQGHDLVAVDPVTGAKPVALPVPFGAEDFTVQAWSADGQHLATASPTGLWVTGLDGASTRLPDNDCTAGCWDPGAMAWSPDGTRIAVAWKPGIVIRDSSSGDTLQLIDTAQLGRSCEPGALAWSPEGQELAFACGTEDSAHGLYLVNADGTGLRTLTDRTTSATDGYVSGGPESLSWSPDGSRIAYLDRMVFDGTVGGVELRTIGRSGGAPTYVLPQYQLGGGANGQRVAWSPDGTALALIAYGAIPSDNCAWCLYVIDADGSDLRLLHARCRG